MPAAAWIGLAIAVEPIDVLKLVQELHARQRSCLLAHSSLDLLHATDDFADLLIYFDLVQGVLGRLPLLFPTPGVECGGPRLLLLMRFRSLLLEALRSVLRVSLVRVVH